VLQGEGYKVALVTDGRMSGASGKVPAAIHVSPEALAGGLIGKVHDGDRIKICGHDGVLELLVPADELAARESAPPPPAHLGTGRELFAFMRDGASDAEAGGSAMLAAMTRDYRL
jgi:phosphogluconate dehydratase